MGRLEGKVIIVTGAGAGIGEAACHRFLHEGAQVLGVDQDPEALERLRSKLSAPEFSTCIADVSRSFDVHVMIERSVDVFGRLDGVFNNAGIVPTGTIEETSEEEWDHQVNVNLKSVFLACRAAIPLMRRTGGGSVVNTASVAGMVGVPLRAAYCASKAGIIGLTRALAKDYARQHLRFNCVCPGTVDTPSWRGRVAASGDPEEAMRTFIDRQPMGRVGAPEEVASAALYLLSDEAAFITGACLVIDGGWTA